MKVIKIYCLLGRKSKLSTSNRIFLYKGIFKPIWTYGIQFWGTASTSNTEILERCHSKVLRMIIEVPKTVIRKDLKTPTIKKESATTALNTVLAAVYTQRDFVVNLMAQPGKNRRLQRHLRIDLPTRLLV
jgi:hypothetical protein